MSLHDNGNKSTTRELDEDVPEAILTAAVVWRYLIFGLGSAKKSKQKKTKHSGIAMPNCTTTFLL